MVLTYIHRGILDGLRRFLERPTHWPWSSCREPYTFALDPRRAGSEHVSTFGLEPVEDVGADRIP